jgi:CheY-like chemotaxis protein
MSPTFLDGKRCLVLDDEFMIAFYIQEVLEEAGASVRSFGDVEQAMKALNGGAEFDLAVLDIKMTGDAHDVMPLVTALVATATPFVFVTGIRIERAMALPLPPAPIVEKPFQPGVLMEALRQALETREDPEPDKAA